MGENKYDDPVFFDKYSRMARSRQGLSEAGEELLELPAREGVEVAPLGLVCRHGLSRVVRRHLEYPHLQGKLHVRV